MITSILIWWGTFFRPRHDSCIMLLLVVVVAVPGTARIICLGRRRVEWGLVLLVLNHWSMSRCTASMFLAMFFFSPMPISVVKSLDNWNCAIFIEPVVKCFPLYAVVCRSLIFKCISSFHIYTDSEMKYESNHGSLAVWIDIVSMHNSTLLYFNSFDIGN